MIRKKKKVTNDFKIKAFVSLLFLIIVFLIGYAYIMYHQKVLARLYFNSIKFDKADRTIRIFDHAGREKIFGKLGRNVMSDKPYNCLYRGTTDGSLCFEWDGIARMVFNFQEKGNVDCLSVRWEALSENIYPVDCYDFSEERGQWYGGGITKEKEWPLNRATFEYAPFVTGDAKVQEFGNALKRYFISSGGVAIQIDDKTPLHLNMNKNNSHEFCMKAMNDEFAFVNRFTKMPHLSYKICIGDDMKSLHQQMTQQSLWDGLKETDIKTVHSILEEPVWQIPAASTEELSESTIYNYTESVIGLGFLRLGHVLVNEFWQKRIGDFTLDTERFQTLEETINILHRRGFKIVFTIQPFISTDSANFREAVQKKILIYERLSERSIPALTRYKSSASAGVLDVTNNASIPWLLEKLDKIVKDYQIDSFFIDFGNAFNMPHYYQCNQSIANPDQYKTIFTSSLEESVSIVGVSGAISVPKPPAFLSLPPVNASWEGLQTIIATVLSYGIIGFPFILPGAVGGDYYLPANNTKMLTYYSMKQPPLVDQELFIRWLQLATFLPAMRFSHLPSEYKSDFVTEVVKELTTIRQKQVIPILKKYLSDAMNEGLPLVRPLWMLDTQDAACLYVNDEFSIGEELIVAPILYQGQTKREGKYLKLIVFYLVAYAFISLVSHLKLSIKL